MIAYPSLESVRAHSSSRRCSRLKYQRLLRGWSLKDVAREVYVLYGLDAAQLGLIPLLEEVQA